jgi:hypothetical protein
VGINTDALYSAWSAIFLGVYVSQSNHMYWIGGVVSSIAAISFMLIQLRVGLGLSSWDDGTSTEVSGPMLFRSQRSTDTQSTAIRVNVLQDTENNGIEMMSVKERSKAGVA